VYLVPAFVGLGAPYWRPEARGALFGLTRASGPNELARAALEAVCYQTRDLLEAMRGDWSADAKSVLRVDGGMVASDWTMQFLADMLDAPVERPTILETTALGAAWLAGQRAGVWPDAAGFAKLWKLEHAFKPKLAVAERERVCRLAECRARGAATCAGDIRQDSMSDISFARIPILADCWLKRCSLARRTSLRRLVRDAEAIAESAIEDTVKPRSRHSGIPDSMGAIAK
jgi:hypothetical protein